MIELGEYAGVVMGSYAASLLLLAAIVALTFWRSRKVKAALEEAEARRG